MQDITTDEVKRRQQAGETIHLLDVREPEERAEFNIGGAFIPLGQVMAMQTDDIEDWKNDEVVVYCRSGRRSLQAGMMLETMGFKNVKNLTGGVLAWQGLNP